MNSDQNTLLPPWIAYLMYAIASAFLCYEMALQVSPSVLTEQLMRELSIDAAGIGALAGVYFYSYTAVQIPAGLLFDRYSMRWIISIALGVCVLGALSFTMTHQLIIAGFGRLLLGIGSAFAFISVLVVSARCFSVKAFALLAGIAQTLAAIGAMCGEAPLSAAFDVFGWRETLWALVIIGAVITLLAVFFIRDIKPKLLDHHQSHEKYGVMQSLKVILNDRQTWWLALYALAGWAPITAFTSLWGVPYLMSIYGISVTKAAVMIAMSWIGLAIASPVIGWLSDRIARRNILLMITALIGLVSSLIIVYVPTVSFTQMFILLFFFGAATSGQILSFALVRDNNKPQVTATAIAFNNMAVVASGAICQPLVGWLLHHHWTGTMHNGLPRYLISDYQFSLFVVPLCFFICFIASLFFINETHCKQRYPQ